MKVKLDVECTPIEARTFLGLPDFTPVHEAMVAKMEEVATKGFDPEDVQDLMEKWMRGGIANFEAMQKAFWEAAAGAKPKS